MVKVTEKEMEFLQEIVTSDFSYDGWGFTDYITDYDYDMKVVRGLISSLVQKGIITHEENSGVTDEKGRYMACAEIAEEYSDIKNHKLINIEVA